MAFLIPNYDFLKNIEPHRKNAAIVLYSLPRTLNTVFSDIVNLITNQTKNTNATRTPNESVQTNIITTAFSGLRNVQISNFLSVSTKEIGDVNNSITVQTDEFYNGLVVRTQGKIVYPESVDITFKEYMYKPITRIMNQWSGLQSDKATGRVGHQSDYKGRIVKVEFDPDVNIQPQDLFSQESEDSAWSSAKRILKNQTRILVFEGAWPSTVPETGMQVDSDDIDDVSITFTIDAVLEDSVYARTQIASLIDSLFSQNA